MDYGGEVSEAWYGESVGKGIVGELGFDARGGEEGQVGGRWEVC